MQLPDSKRVTAFYLTFCSVLISGSLSSSSSISSARLFSTTSSSCSICPNPKHSITLPNASIPIFGTCADLEASIDFILPDYCRIIQSVSTLCGCPVSKSSCFLCNHNYNGPIDSSRPVPYLLDVPAGVNVTCDIVQAYLHSIPAKNQTCTLIKGLVGPYCGCPSQSGDISPSSNSNSKGCSLCASGQAPTRRNRTLTTGLDLPFLRSCGDLENVAKTYWQDGSDTCRAVQSFGVYCGCPFESAETEPCSFCSDGSAAPLVNKTIPFLKDEFNVAGILPTCGLADAAIQSIPSTDERCASLQILGSNCGCPPIPNHCVYCPKPGDNVTMPDLVVKQFGQVSYGLNDVTCEVIYSTQYQVPGDSDMCWKAQSKNYLCGCNGGQFDYMGADTIAKKRVLAWMPRISALLSILGSIVILVHIYRYHRSPLDQYHELVACISIFDLFGSLATMLTTLPIPVEDGFGQPTGIYGAHGTIATCKAQGFFIHLGYTGIFYNLSLATYYVLVVNYGYREHDLKRVRKWLHLPLLVGLTLSFVAIPYIDNFICFCHVQSPPMSATYRHISAIALVPITIAMLLSAIGMFLVYVKVLRQTRSSNRWRFGSGGGAGGKLARKVFWQSFFFVVALYGSWPILVVAVFSGNSRKTFEMYWFWVIALTLAPLQGFFNFFVYTRPQIIRYLKRHRRRRIRRRELSRRKGTSWRRLALRLTNRLAANGPIRSPELKYSYDKEEIGPSTKDTLDEDSHVISHIDLGKEKVQEKGPEGSLTKGTLDEVFVIAPSMEDSLINLGFVDDPKIASLDDSQVNPGIYNIDREPPEGTATKVTSNEDSYLAPMNDSQINPGSDNIDGDVPEGPATKVASDDVSHLPLSQVNPGNDNIDGEDLKNDRI